MFSSKFSGKYRSEPWAVPQLRQLAAGFSPQWPEFEPKSGHVGFVVIKVALW
jgi:hypothetical protein